MLTPVDRAFGELGIDRRVALQVAGFLPLPFVIEGTDMVAVVPERLARIHMRGDGPLVLVEPPFDEVVLAEGYWFASDRLSDPAHRWLFAGSTRCARSWHPTTPEPDAAHSQWLRFVGAVRRRPGSRRTGRPGPTRRGSTAAAPRPRRT